MGRQRKLRIKRIKRKARFKKGSLAAKRFMASIRRKKHSSKRVRTRRPSKHRLQISKHLSHRRHGSRRKIRANSKTHLSELVAATAIGGVAFGLLGGNGIAQPAPAPSPSPTPTPTPSPDIVTISASASPTTGTQTSVITVNGIATSSQSVIQNIHFESTDGHVNYDAQFPQSFSNFATTGTKTLNITATDALGQSATTTVSFVITGTQATTTTTSANINFSVNFAYVNGNVVINGTGFTPNGFVLIQRSSGTFGPSSFQTLADSNGNINTYDAGLQGIGLGFHPSYTVTDRSSGASHTYFSVPL